MSIFEREHISPTDTERIGSSSENRELTAIYSWKTHGYITLKCLSLFHIEMLRLYHVERLRLYDVEIVMSISSWKVWGLITLKGLRLYYVERLAAVSRQIISSLPITVATFSQVSIQMWNSVCFKLHGSPGKSDTNKNVLLILTKHLICGGTSEPTGCKTYRELSEQSFSWYIFYNIDYIK